MAVVQENATKDIGDLLGGFKLWQGIFFAAVVYVWGILTLGSMSVTFLGPQVEFHCAVNSESYNWSHWTETKDHCSYVMDKDDEEVMAYPCTSWTFNDTFYSFSYTEKFNLVCGRSYLIALSNSLYMIGEIVGCGIITYLADRFGRKPIIFVATIPGVLASFMTLFAPNVTIFLLARVLYGASGTGLGSVTTVLLMEICGVKYRGVLATAGNLGWAAFYIALPGFAYWLRDSSKIQILITIFYSSLLLVNWFVPESPRWLILNKKTKKAEKLLTKICKINKLQSVSPKQIIAEMNTRIHEREKGTPETARETYLDLFRYPATTRRTIILYFYWFVCSFVYYGLSLNAKIFGSNVLLNFFLLGLIEIPSYVIYSYLFKEQNRRIHLASTMILSGLFCALVAAVPTDTTWAIILMVIVGKFFITASFSIIYPYSCEMYPTSIRSTALGCCSVCARIAGVVAPFAGDLDKIIGLSAVMGIFGSFGITSGALIYFLPETNGIVLPDTLLQGENIGKNKGTEKNALLGKHNTVG